MDSPIMIYNDNHGCITLSKNPVHHDNSKHIAMHHHFLCRRVEDGSIMSDIEIMSAYNKYIEERECVCVRERERKRERERERDSREQCMGMC
jgi:hypothetical protein